MASATFDVHLTAEHEPPRVGDEVTVEVSVTPEASHDAVTLHWEVGWTVSGKTVNTSTVASGACELGAVEADVAATGTFSFTVPREGPVTYHGTLFHVAWFVEVSLDIPWAIDPKATFPFEVRARVVRRKRPSKEESEVEREGDAEA